VRWPAAIVLCACSFSPGASAIDAGGDGPDLDGPGTVLRQKTLTVTATIAGTHAGFPLWLDVTDAELAAHARTDGSDLHFVDPLGGALAYQLQRWDQATGRLEAWVRVPSLSSGTQLVLRYGDASAAHPPASAGVFLEYAAVWHLEDDPTGTTIIDARGATPGVASDLAASASVPGQLGRAIDFGGGAGQILFTNPLSGNTAHTISMWVDQRATTDNDAMVVLGNGVQHQARWFHSRFDGATIAVGFYSNDFPNPGHDIQGAGWVLLHWVYEGANRMTRLYRDGQLVAGPRQHNPNVNTQGTDGFLGNAPGAFGQNMGLHAALDEVRILASARSAEWIAAEAANQRAPQTFFTIGPEQLP
jgi:hypothetical protein